MKTIFTPLITLLLLSALPPTAGATLCGPCRGKNFITSVGHCKVCAGGMTSSGAFKVCKQCSAKLAQCEACQQDLKPKTEPLPGGKTPPAKAKAYPAHWGPPPRLQTKDLRPLPGGYGMGSDTLAQWIQKNLNQDGKAPAAPEKKKLDHAEEITRVEKQIADMEEFATRARFTPEGLKKLQQELATLRERLQELKGETKPQ